MTDFYDYGPQVALDSPVVISGCLTELSRGVAYRTSALLGLTFHDIDRRVEHTFGHSLRKVVALEGEAAYRSAEASCLRRALGEKPAGIIALGDGGLLDQQSRERIAEGGKLVILDVDLPNLYWQALRAASRTQTGDWHPLYPGLPSSMDDLRPFFQPRQAAFTGADLRLDAIKSKEAEASKRLIRWIEDLER